MRGWTRRDKLKVGALAFLFWIGGCTSLPTSNTAKEPGAGQGGTGSQVQAPAPAPVCSTSASVCVPYIPPPNNIDLCGEPVPLDRRDVYERFDKEFTLIVYNHAQVYLWLKRMERFFPSIEERLRQFDLPDDLKYVAIVESDLLPDACSPKGAAGPWQFMPGTGAAYGLEQRKSVDKRYDFERSTDSAFLLLKDLYKKYHSWSLAIAAYNCGDRRILDESRVQGVRSYYDMRLPQETERYVFRIIAVKTVLGNPGRYGYDLPKEFGYQELKLDRVNVSLSRPVSIQTIAGCAGTTYREIKRLNPAFRSGEIPEGNHEIKLPLGAGELFKKNFAARAGSGDTETRMAQGQDLEESSVPPPVTHTPAPARSKSLASVSHAKARSAGAKKKTAKAGQVKGKKTGSAATASHGGTQKTRVSKAGAPKSEYDKKSTTRVAAHKANRKKK